MVENALADWNLSKLDFLFIENVGNLVCPSSYDLGESVRLVLISATEGEDKPLKYPTIFNSADVAVITKIDLAQAVEFDWAAASSQHSGGPPGHASIQSFGQIGRTDGRLREIRRGPSIADARSSRVLISIRTRCRDVSAYEFTDPEMRAGSRSRSQTGSLTQRQRQGVATGQENRWKR